MPNLTRAHDCLVNVHFGDQEQPEWMFRVKNEYFKRGGLDPPSLLHYMRTRGKQKIIFASDAPVLSITRTVTEARQLDLAPELLDNYLYANAQEFFFDRLASPPSSR